MKLAKEIKELENLLKTIQDAKLDSNKRQSEIDKLIAERDALVEASNSLNIVKADQVNISIVIKELDEKIEALNMAAFIASKEIEKIHRSILASQKLKFDFSDTEELYSQIEIYFSSALKNDLNKLKEFNEAVFENRITTLNSILKDKEIQFESIKTQISEIDQERAKRIAFIMDSDSLQKYREIHSKLIGLERSIAVMERNVVSDNIEELQSRISKKQSDHFEAASILSKEIDNNRGVFTKIAETYSMIMREVMQIDARIIVKKLKTGNLDVVVKSYRGGIETDELRGATAKKISSAAVDISMRAIQNIDHGFIIQDGIIDEVDNNSATKFIQTVKKLAVEHNFQYIMTALKDRLPSSISKSDIVIELNDYTESGLLFGRRY